MLFIHISVVFFILAGVLTFFSTYFYFTGKLSFKRYVVCIIISLLSIYETHTTGTSYEISYYGPDHIIEFMKEIKND